MLSDLSALVPPLLVCIAFLIAVGAFLKHEMGHRGSSGDDEADEPDQARNQGEPGGRTGDGESFRQGPNSDSSDPPRRSDG